MCGCHEQEDDWNLDELCSGDTVVDEREDMWDFVLFDAQIKGCVAS